MNEYNAFKDKLEEEQSEIPYTPAFRLLIWGISTCQMREGMTPEEAFEAAALFCVEAEACILEIMAISNQRLSMDIFRQYPDDIHQLSMPFWKEPESVLHILPEEFVPQDSSILEIPPTISLRSNRRSC